MSSEPKDEEAVVATMLCPVCEADLSPIALVCLRCGHAVNDSRLNPWEAPKKLPSVPKDIAAMTSSASTMVSVALTVGLIGILAATLLASPGLGICLALLMIPAWIRTTLVVFKRSRSGLETGNLQKTTLFVGSAFVTWLVLFVALISCCLTFCAMCWGVMITNADRMNDQVLLYVLWGSVGVTFILVLLAFSPWIRNRWKRDTIKEK